MRTTKCSLSMGNLKFSGLRLSGFTCHNNKTCSLHLCSNIKTDSTTADFIIVVKLSLHAYNKPIRGRGLKSSSFWIRLSTIARCCRAGWWFQSWDMCSNQTVQTCHFVLLTTQKKHKHHFKYFQFMALLHCLWPKHFKHKKSSEFGINSYQRQWQTLIDLYQKCGICYTCMCTCI